MFTLGHYVVKEVTSKAVVLEESLHFNRFYLTSSEVPCAMLQGAVCHVKLFTCSSARPKRSGTVFPILKLYDTTLRCNVYFLLII